MRNDQHGNNLVTWYQYKWYTEARTGVISMDRYDRIYDHPYIGYIFCARVEDVRHGADLRPNGTWHCAPPTAPNKPTVPYTVGVQEWSWGIGSATGLLVRRCVFLLLLRLMCR